MDHSVEEEMTVKDSETLPLYNLKQKETVHDVKINPALTVEQQEQVKKLLTEFEEIFSDVPKVTHLFEHKGMVWYGILEFNVPLDTVYFSTSEMGASDIPVLKIISV